MSYNKETHDNDFVRNKKEWNQTLERIADDLMAEKEEMGNETVLAFNAKSMLKSKPRGRADDNDEKEKQKFTPYEIACSIISCDFKVIEGQLYRYNKKHCNWQILDLPSLNVELRRIIPYEFSAHVNKYSLEEIYYWMISILENERQTFDKNRHYLNFRDCSYNWLDDSIIIDEEERKALCFRYYLDLDFLDLEEDRNTGEFKSFMDFVFGDDNATRQEFKKAIGLCLSDIRDNKTSIVLYGPSNSGKTVFLNTLKEIVGSDFCSSVSFSQMTVNDFALGTLLKSRLNLSGEMSGTVAAKLEVFKSIVGNDDVTTSFKFKDSFSMRARCLLAFATNSYPKISNIMETDSFYDRLSVFNFSNVKPRDEWVQNYAHILAGDAHNIIKYAIEGLKLLHQDNYVIHQTEAMTRIKASAAHMTDSFTPFASRYICIDPKGKLTTQEIINKYTEYCERNEYPVIESKVWSEILKRLHNCCACTISTTDESGAKHRVRGYRGINFVPDIFDVGDAL